MNQGADGKARRPEPPERKIAKETENQEVTGRDHGKKLYLFYLR